MITAEPQISVGIIENTKEARGVFNGLFELPNSIRIKGAFKAVAIGGKIILYDDEGIEVTRSSDIKCVPLSNATFMICNVSIGIKFHWEKKEDQAFEGTLRLLLTDEGKICVINEIGIEDYLKSVIASEMSGESPKEFLKAQAITSRSWLAGMLEKQKKSKNIAISTREFCISENEIIRWYDREDHLHFDVCADDHCQRYQGITKNISKSVEEAVNETRGLFLTHENQICDTRFSKACGGRTELFENCWEDEPKSYLISVADSAKKYSEINNETEAEKWMSISPECYCNTSDKNLLRQILPKCDQSTSEFFRWTVEYLQEEIAEIIFSKSGIDFGAITNIEPIKRGPSGRIYHLKIIGTKRSITVGKELEIRRWLSKSHLYSSAFVVKIERDKDEFPSKFIFNGAGWGHGVGLCQVGAAVMAIKGFKAKEILEHYFKNTGINKLY